MRRTVGTATDYISVQGGNPATATDDISFLAELSASFAYISGGSADRPHHTLM
jgi:hypothetical protein